VLPPLPPSLQTLVCFRNQLSALPEPLPPTLQKLVCGANRIAALPFPLPESLHTLACGGNTLIALPPLPPTLTFLAVHINRLSTLPYPLPATLTTLLCSDNPLQVSPLDGESPAAFSERLHAADQMVVRARCVARCHAIKEELMMDRWSPARIEKRLAAGMDLEQALDM
jgi:Leucine-rich repeat (LRR) protein